MSEGPNPGLFFQITSALIPALLFGGVVVEALKRRGPAPVPTSARALGGKTHVLLLGLLGVVVVLGAEVFSLAGALGGVGAVGTWWVALTVIDATVSLTILLVSPRLGWQHWPRSVLYLNIAGVLLFALAGAAALKGSVDAAANHAHIRGTQLVRDVVEGPSGRDAVYEVRDALMRIEEEKVRARLLAGTYSRKRAGRELLAIAERRARFLRGVEIQREDRLKGREAYLRSQP
jgi:hypothetical protein